MRFLFVAVLAFSSIATAPAQTGSVVSAGYRLPDPLDVAPGQIITLFARRPAGDPGVSAVVSGAPLPLSLGGASVVLRQSDWPVPLPLPIQAVYPVFNCAGLDPADCTPLLAISVQIPWQLTPNLDRGGRPNSFASLSVRYQGVVGEPFPLRPETDAVHSRSTCDTTLPPGADPLTSTPGPCRAVAFHEDGELVTAASPAKAGEVVTLHFYGLGRTAATPDNGALPESPAQVAGVEVGFQFGPNLKAVRPDSPETPLEASLTATRVGVYQVKVTVPALPEGLSSCTASSVVSNLTVTVARQASFDGAGICVE